MAQPWFRFYHEALDDPKVQSLPAETFKGWVNMLCLACRNDGKLPDLTAVSFAFRMSEFETEKLFHELESLRLIDRKRGTLTPHKWNERQYKSDVSTDRVKEFRKRKRNVSLPLPETPPEQIQNRAETEQKGNPQKPPSPPAPSLFEKFWESYPKKRGKGQALKAWRKENLDKQVDQIIGAVEKQKKWPDWQREHGQYIPHPASWLNMQGWLDEFWQPIPPDPESPKPHSPHFCGTCDVGHEWDCEDALCGHERNLTCPKFVREYNAKREANV